MKNPIYLTLGSLLLAGINLSAATLYVSTNSPDPQPPYASWSTAATNIQAAVSSAEAGDFIVVTDGVYYNAVYYGSLNVSNAVTLVSVNGANSTVINGGNPCISLADGASLIGFTVTGGRIYNESPAGGVVCSSPNVVLINCVITNNMNITGSGGVFGGTLYNCTIVDNAASESGDGGGAGLSTLNNCTITGNYGDSAGGVSGCTLNYCTLTDNSALNYGGGAYGGTLNNCIISDNGCGTSGGGAIGSALNDCLVCSNGALSGGGASGCVLDNCTLTGNSAGGESGGPFPSGGAGAYECALTNCISYFNSAPAGYATNYDTNSILNYCCTTLLPASGIGNITNNPLFVNPAGGNFQLQSNSPCINAGNNAYVDSATDLNGNPRIVGGTVDMGAYEFQTPTSVISYAYLQEYGLPTDGSVDFTDLDGTGFNVYQDWVAGLNPTNPASVLAMLSPLATNNLAGVTVRWKSVSGVQYLLQRSTNLLVQPVFPTIQENIPGQGGTNTYQDSSATNKTPYFYRVGVVAP
ncbi:MAG TPA: right-handed parallel beta-helix repeat-containing protein [Candidatus Sulfotelmatobacter sp.]|nr:right-handed parallel beta-helix repeat-containing protein [Candidatus Sulfotelmatobacter sp.]